MTTERHTLLAGFPAFRDAIHRLETEEALSRRLFDEYHDPDPVPHG